MKLGSLDGGEDGEHTGICVVEISGIFAVQDVIFFGTGPLDGVYCIQQCES